MRIPLPPQALILRSCGGSGCAALSTQALRAFLDSIDRRAHFVDLEASSLPPTPMKPPAPNDEHSMLSSTLFCSTVVGMTGREMPDMSVCGYVGMWEVMVAVQVYRHNSTSSSPPLPLCCRLSRWLVETSPQIWLTAWQSWEPHQLRHPQRPCQLDRHPHPPASSHHPPRQSCSLFLPPTMWGCAVGGSWREWWQRCPQR